MKRKWLVKNIFLYNKISLEYRTEGVGRFEEVSCTFIT